MTTQLPAAQPAPQPAARPRVRLDTLTGLRGVLAMTVFIFHAGTGIIFTRAISLDILRGDVGPGQAAVAFFFMLSGFVLVWVARQGEPVRAFLRRRVAKIYPNHLTTWLVGLGLMMGFGIFTSWPDVLPSLVLVHAWIPIPDVLYNVDGPNWSLSNEMFFYLLFPLFLGLIHKVRPERLWRWVYITAGIVFVWTTLVGVLVPSEPKVQGIISAYQFYILIWFPLSRLPDFVLGMLIARIVMTGQWRPVRNRWVVGLLCVAWALSMLLPMPLGFVAPFLPGLVLLIGNAATADIRGTRNFFTWRPVVWMGDVSFAFYLIHALVLQYAHLAIEDNRSYPVPYALLFLAGCLTVSFVLAHYLRRFVEEPAMRRFSRPRRPPAQPVASEHRRIDVQGGPVEGREQVELGLDRR